MTIEELIEELRRAIRNGADPESEVLVRNSVVSEAAMEAGSKGYVELEEVLLVPATGEIYLLIPVDH